MKLRDITKIANNYIYQNLGWTTKRKIIIFESDDWGSIRMPSKAVYNYLLDNQVNIGDNPFNKYDTLESNSDLVLLFELLSTFKNNAGNSPQITANYIVANPDFKKIRESNFLEYYFEEYPFTLKQYPNREMVLSLISDGIKNKLFIPQFHGREHINVLQWLLALRNKIPDVLKSFDVNSFCIGNNQKFKQSNFMAAFDFDTKFGETFVENTVREGLKLFEKLFRYASKSIIAPAAVWHPNIERLLSEIGVRYLQGFIVQKIPTLNKLHYERKFHFLGEKNKFAQCYLTRNCYFEPSTNPDLDWVDKCLHQINCSFILKKPAIVSTHRINFVGGIEEKNRERNLKLFKLLLEGILKKWPNIEWMSSDDLGDLIQKGNK